VVRVQLKVPCGCFKSFGLLYPVLKEEVYSREEQRWKMAEKKNRFYRFRFKKKHFDAK